MARTAPVKQSMRLAARPGEVINRSRPLRFTWDGHDYPAFLGDSISSALAASGERVLSRSFKYSRPRGVLTADSLDPGCMVQVGDEPNVRASHRMVEDGMIVGPQNVWPSLRFDVKAANRTVSRFLSAGFYYKTFIKPQRLWPAYEAVLKRFAAGGVVENRPVAGYFDKRYAHPDVVVAGGGPAGMAAAVAAAQAGAQVMLVESEHDLGGHLRWGGEQELSALAELRAAVDASHSIEVLTDSVVAGRYDGNFLAIVQRSLPGITERLIKARAKTLVVAPGLIERPYVFAGNDLPGVMLSSAARRLINLWAVKPGTRAVVFTANTSGDAAVTDLEDAGVEVCRVEDVRRGGDVVRASGSGATLRSVECGDGRTYQCDLLVTATGWTAPTSLLNMAGDKPTYDERAARFFPGVLPEDVLATGGITGDGSLEQILEHAAHTGRLAAARGRQVAARLRAGVPHAPPTDPPALRESMNGMKALPIDAHPALFRGRTHGIVDFSEDVSSKELEAAVAEGYNSIELAKRYTTATMGSAQGKLEVVNAVAVVAAATDSTIAETGTTVWRPPYAPITLGALAGRTLEPARYSPMQSWHETHGAAPLVAGAWIRPDHYGDPGGEVRNVRTNVGLIDVTPLGKFDLQGPDTAKLLGQLYVNKWAKLAVGSVRYGVMCAEDGVVLDDGVTGRLADEHYLMTATSSGADTLLEWAESWLQTEHPEWRVHITPVTSDFASINVAGPKSRTLLERVVEGVDLSAEAFPYMRVRRGQVAGVEDCLMWRIGFTGELSFELHVPSSYGLRVWESLMEQGADLGIAPFGIEAQRILRLEKGHLIVGQDTDGLTRAYSAELDWAIKLDKEDFAGKPELVWQAERSDWPKLVGLRPVEETIVPPEGSQIVHDGAIAGRITSSRMSPTLERSICLGQVAPHLAEPGTEISVVLPVGGSARAVITEHLAHFDPEGQRLRG
ncbi:MAG: 2Fe-2S iron-sulfur cluster-binding protein [Actinomycetota bacterium]|nr:2Fe-2S iron-sulfur cluster-binding protein [Actinomycetota bacterium]